MIRRPFCTKLCMFAVLGCVVALLAGCGGSVKDNVRGTLGLNKEAPDEFAVIRRAPLEMPTTMTLPEPTPGQHRPQEKTTITAAKEAVFGENKQKSLNSQSSIEALLLEKTGAENAPENIRSTVNTETQDLAERNMPVADKLLGLTGGETAPSASVVDAKAEYERIKKNLEEGKSVLDGETPTIEE